MSCKFNVGDECWLTDLESKSELNGRHVLLKRWVEEKQRWRCAPVGWEHTQPFLAVKTENLSEDPPLGFGTEDDPFFGLKHLMAKEGLPAAKNCVTFRMKPGAKGTGATLPECLADAEADEADEADEATADPLRHFCLLCGEPRILGTRCCGWYAGAPPVRPGQEMTGMNLKFSSWPTPFDPDVPYVRK